MATRPFASIIIPTYNGKSLLATCLDALKRQTYPASHFEIIVVDDASRDGTAVFVSKAHPEVRLIALQENHGFVAACNTGVGMAQGEILALLNNDTEPEPRWLEALVEGLTQHPEAGSAASKLLLFDRRDTLHTTGDMMGQDGVPRNRGVWEQDMGQYDQDLWVFGACGGAAAYRRCAWEAAGGLEETLFMYLDDVDLAWRLQLLGWKSLYVPESRVYHRLSATGGGRLASYYTGRNTLWVIARNWPGGLLRRHWRAILASQLRITWDALRAWRGEAARARLRGQLAGLLGLPRIAVQRSTIQRQRRVSIEYLDSLMLAP
jgi:GT2 family glycosyltransferase